jgi:drug/metabolite transporter (DMT)-like permease
VYRREFKRVARKDLGWFSVVIGFTLFTVAPIMYAFQHLELGTASFLFYASFTIFSYIFGFYFFKERLTVVKLMSLVLAFVGLSLVFSVKFSPHTLIPILLAVFNGLTSAGEVTFSKKISGVYSNTQIVFWVFFLIGVTHFVVSLMLGERQDLSLLTHSFPVLMVFVVVAIGGMFAIIEGFKNVEPSIGALIGLMEIVFSVIFGIVLFHELLNFSILLGGFLILIAAALPNISDYFATRRRVVPSTTTPD